MKDCQSVILVAAAIVPSCNVAADASSSCGSVKQLQSSHHVDYFVTLRISSKTNKKFFGLLQSGGPWHKCVNGLGLNDFLGQVTSSLWWFLAGISAAGTGFCSVSLWLRELLVVSSSLTWGWGLELVLNSISGNDVVVDSVQHCQPSCLSSVLKGGPL